MTKAKGKKRGAPKLGHAAGLALLAAAAHAEPLDLGDGIEARWTNSVRLSSLYQIDTLPPAMAGYCPPSQPVNCGYEQGFSQGRVDWQSELGLARGDEAIHVSLDARKEVVERDASYLELFEAYAQTGATLFGRPLTVSLGRQNVIWGESLLFPANAIAGAQAPIDATQGHGAVGYQSAIRFLPLAQAALTWAATADWALLFYQQAEWRRSRVDPHDAYAGAADVLGAEANDVIALGFPHYYGHVAYYRAGGGAPGGLDQFGIGVKGRVGDGDLGLYALRYDAKSPALAFFPDDRSYRLVYAKGVELVGASLAAEVAESSLTAELSARHRAPLVTGGFFTDYGDGAGPRGDTLQGQLALTRAIDPQGLLPGGASWTGELAFNHLLGFTDDAQQLARSRTSSAAALRSVFTAQFYQLWPRIDLSLPVSVGYNFLGLSPVLAEMNRGTGDVGIGASFSLDQRWNLSLAYTHYFGSDKIPEAPYGVAAYGGKMSQWDDVALVLQTSF
jgi:hypothetical protein